MSDTHGTTPASATANRSATPDHRGATGVATDAGRYTENRERRITTETKSSYKTTELIAYVAAVIGVLIASAVTDTSDFGTQEAWFYITLLTIGYLVSRGLAKSGSSEPFDDEHKNR